MKPRYEFGQLLYGFAVALLSAVALAGYFWYARHPGRFTPEGVECEAAYDEARNSAESTAVDRLRPVPNRRRTSIVTTCGMLLRSGELNQR